MSATALGAFDKPIKTGQTVRLFVGNIGPNLVTSCHVIGEIFDTVYARATIQQARPRLIAGSTPTQIVDAPSMSNGATP